MDSLNLPKRITFDGNPEFTKRLVLEGENESAIRAFFTPRIIGFFDKKRKVWLRPGFLLSALPSSLL